MTTSVVRLTDQQDNPMERMRKLIKHPPENSRVFEITPEMARIIIEEYNNGNRPRKPAKISEYAEDMRNGRWPLTGDTLKFSDAERLRDGQNRLMACIRSDAAFLTHIVFGIPDDAFMMLDKGKNRNGTDVLAMAGYKNTAALAGAIRWTRLIDSGRAKQRDTLRPDELLPLIRNTYPGLVDHVPQGQAIYAGTGQPLSLAIAMLFLFTRANKAMASDFATAWETGERGGRFKPLDLMQRQIGQLQAASSGRVHDVVRAALIIMAWNLFLQRRKGTQTEMRWRPSDPFPEVGH
jgi:hypothetical protein